MAAITDWREQVRASLPVDSSTDPAVLSVPGAMVGPVADLTQTTGCVWEGQLSVWLVAPAPAGAVALEWLEDALPGVLAALPGVTAVEFATYTHHSGALPAYRIDITAPLDLEATP